MSIMQQLIFDRTRYTDTLRKAGIVEDTARAHSDALNDALHEAVATKADLNVLQAENKAEFLAVRSEITSVRTEMKSEFAAVRSEMKAEFAAVRSEAKSEFADVRSEFAAMRTDMALLRADMNKQFGDSHAVLIKQIGDNQTSNLKWFTALIIPLYVALAAFAWQLRAPPAPSAPRAAISQPAVPAPVK
jgi:hypothetical protein